MSRALAAHAYDSKPASENNADNPAMEGHAAFPDTQDAGGIVQIYLWLVEDGISQATAQNDANDAPG